MSYVVETLASAISGRNRRDKFQDFLLRLEPSETDKIIDVGVNDEEYSDHDNFLEKNYKYPQNITAVSQFKLARFPSRYPLVRAVTGDGLDLPFEDQSFAIAYSNAVIEHVGSQQSQIQFLRELKRVGRKGYVTTPSREFPVELHTRIPLLHLILTKQLFDKFLIFIGKEWATGNYMNLLGRKELEYLLKAAGIRNYNITTSRLLGLPLTYTVTW